MTRARKAKEVHDRISGISKVADKLFEEWRQELDKYSDRVLFLTHNLNARALGSLQGASATLQADVGALIGEMEKSIAEAAASSRR